MGAWYGIRGYTGAGCTGIVLAGVLLALRCPVPRSSSYVRLYQARPGALRTGRRELAPSLRQPGYCVVPSRWPPSFALTCSPACSMLLASERPRT
ncbi:hypothetical protein C2E23DRAFT_248276 [Lenzites betulinus]|nr:hypothetical protein C2E23DRAFT_248276 [Lenzites betulinus]